MEIEVEVPLRFLIGAGIAALLTFFGVLGYFVTPVEAGEPVLLTPDRWHAIRLARAARAETEALRRDAEELRHLLEEDRPSPVDAMLLAERIYARHREGTAATGPARQALIEAAEKAVLFASGAASRDEAVEAANRAFRLIENLGSVTP